MHSTLTQLVFRYFLILDPIRGVLINVLGEEELCPLLVIGAATEPVVVLTS